MAALPPDSKNSIISTPLLLIAIGIIVIAASLFAYLMWYVSPDVVIEQVKIIGNTESGCIAETPDGFAMNIGQCDANPGEYVLAPIDQKVKERALLMNPTGR